ncbi:MAG: SDR family NAD(P)-dependent oxidoreductase [Ignavibacteriaceae bacterium]|nr:SDR family NAD(P)-dependent oxidoreductase [Ignavibacteriaceae bacterium]
MSNSIKGKIVLITGASSGIGLACAKRFAKAGCKLILLARRKGRIESLADELNSKFRTKTLNVVADVRKRKVIADVFLGLPAEWKDISILINNAGLSRGLDKIQDGKYRDWDEMIDTNLKGVLNVTKSVLPLLMKQSMAHIINIGSTAGHEVYQGGNVYCASKFALKALTKGMRIDLLGSNIKVTSIDPGLVETEFSLVRFRGNKQKASNVYKGLKALNGNDVAEAVYFVASRNSNTVIAEIVLMPRSQASSVHVKRY